MKTIKSLLIVEIATIMALSVKAQNLNGGIIGGVSTGPVKVTNIERGFTDAMEGKNVYGYEGGIFVKFLIDPIYIKPQLLYSAREGEVKYIQKPSGEFGSINRTADFRLEKFEAPVLFGYNILESYLSVEAGPVYNYIVTMNGKYNENELELERHGLGYRAGISSEIGPLLLQLGIQGLTNFSVSDKATYNEPYKIIFGAGLILAETK